MNLIEQLGGYEKAKIIVNSALDFTHIDIYDGFEYFIYEKQNGNGDINDVLTLNPRLNHTGSAFIQGGLDKYGGWHIGINEIKTALLEYRRQHNIYEHGDKIIVDWDPCQIFTVDLVFPEIRLISALDSSGNKVGNASFDRIKHATDEEIKAGKRRPELDSDTCSDIRNHVSPLTKVIDR